MGRFVYNSTLNILLDDEELGHLQAVIGAKFRLQQSFYFTWTRPASTGEYRSTIWLTPHIPLQFHYRRALSAALDRDRINDMYAQANSPGGLLLLIDP